MKTLDKQNLTSARWIKGNDSADFGENAFRNALLRVGRPMFIVRDNDRLGIGSGGSIVIGEHGFAEDGYPMAAYIPALHPDQLGSPDFKRRHHLRYPYVVGAMANGITSTRMVEAAGKAGMIGFFGAAGLSLSEIEAALVKLFERMKGLPFGTNLIYSPNEPDFEDAVVRLYLEKGVRRISASAYMDLTLPLVYYRVKGIYLDHRGVTVCPNKVVAKVSRVEVARKFFSPPPEKLIARLLSTGKITRQEADLAAHVPMADDLTAEADSGGHTDNRPALTLLPTMTALRDRISKKYGYAEPPTVGLAGGIATPESVAAAFSMGAAYVLAGSIHQACVEAGTSETVRQMLAQAQQADVVMAPAADMFEMGVKVQVLKRGTMFAFRAAKLFELYSRYDRYESIPEKERLALERDFLRMSFDDAWQQTASFFAERDPRQIDIAEKKPKHKMALIFRSYLGRSSMWAINGVPDRRIDYQIWCGPAMGAFNEWVRGTFLEVPENRKTVTVAMNLLVGASVLLRSNLIRCAGVEIPEHINGFAPMPIEDIQQIIDQ